MARRIPVGMLILGLSLCGNLASPVPSPLLTVEVTGVSSPLPASPLPTASPPMAPATATLPGTLSPISPTATYRLYRPGAFRQFALTSPDEWTQHAHDAQRTSYTNQAVPPPWRWKWAWNGPDAQGRVSPGKFRLPRNSQPVTGGGRVYIAAGDRGVFALDNADGRVLWNRNPGGARINSTPAYDPDTGSLFVLSTSGTLYRLNAATGEITGQFPTGAVSDLPLPPALFGDRVFFSMGDRVYAVHKSSMSLLWSYDAGAPVHTPPAYSPSWDRVVVATQDLYVHAIRNVDGSRAWRVKPTVRQPGDPGDSFINYAEVKNGWPVIAEGHGLVLIKLRLDSNAVWNPWSPWPQDNTTMREGLAARPEYQALFALRLTDGAQAFIANVGHGGFGDGGYLPMGPQPVVKRFPNGQEIAYVVMRGSPCLQSPCDGRWDSRLGEMLLDSDTIPGYQAGDVRFMQNTFFPTDEQANLSMAGDHIFGGHWMFGIAHEIMDRSPSRGTAGDPITVCNLPHIITSASNCGFSPSHYCPDSLTQDGDPRTIPGGFYIYYNQGPVYDQYWTEYATWVVSNQTIYFVSGDGALVALEHGDPLSVSKGPESSVNIPFVRDSSLTPTAISPRLDRVISYAEAHLYAGQIATVEGTIRFVFNNGKAVYLGFRNPHQGAFKVRILQPDWKAFPLPPEWLYPVGTRIRVHGLIEWYQGDPQIIVRDPAQIQILQPLKWTDLILGLRGPAGWLLGNSPGRGDLYAVKVDASGMSGRPETTPATRTTTPATRGTAPATQTGAAPPTSVTTLWTQTIPQCLSLPAGTGLAIAGDPDGNGVWDSGEAVTVVPAWTNNGTTPVTATGSASNVVAPPDVTASLTDAAAAYGTIPPGGTADCQTATGDCYAITGTRTGTGHRDVAFDETLTTVVGSILKTWTLHIGPSFADVATNVFYYKAVETLLHRGVTGGCTASDYCPLQTVNRAQMAVFISRAVLGTDPPAVGSGPGGSWDCTDNAPNHFTDVPDSAFYCPHVHWMWAHNIAGGCTATTYCPLDPVNRAQMAVFISRAVLGVDPPAVGSGPGGSWDCTDNAPNHFTDVSDGVPYCPHVHWMWANNVTGGCTATTYCPLDPVNRAQMATFLVRAFHLLLYGP